MKRRRCLDLFSGGGGAAIGIRQAGFHEIVGIDIKMHRNYPFDFIQADVLQLPVNLDDFDFVWASPPCQKYSNATINRIKATLPDLIPDVRAILKGHPLTCIENVPSAPIHKILELTGPSVGLRYIQRRRYFEMSFVCPQLPAPAVRREDWESGQAITVWTGMSPTNALQRERREKAGLSTGNYPKSEVKEKMGIPDHYEMTHRELGEAVAPPKAKYIAEWALKYLE